MATTSTGPDARDERLDPDQFAVLHAVRCMGAPSLERLARRLRRDHAWIQDRLGELADRGLVVSRQAAAAIWTLTPEGRNVDAQLVRAEIDERGARATVEDAYQRFLALNGEMLAVCSAWQMRVIDGVQHVNDHTDPDYDAAQIARLAEVHDAVLPILSDLAACLPRFDVYADRFEDALARVRGGEPAWLTGVLVDSYHLVWFELHEDLLATLGISREQEAARQQGEA